MMRSIRQFRLLVAPFSLSEIGARATDEEFKWMTARLLDLKINSNKYTVYVRPEVVVEVAFDEIQTSPHYKSGYALRFARITRIREDKSPKDSDTISSVREIFEAKFKRKGKPHRRQ